MSDVFLALWHLFLSLAGLYAALYALWAMFFKIPQLERLLHEALISGITDDRG